MLVTGAAGGGATVRRLSAPGLVSLAEGLSARDRAICEAVGRLRLVSAVQLQRLFFAESESPATAARLTRRALARLVELRILARLERRVGGVRAGSAGWVYTLDVAGQRLTAYWRGEGLARTRMVYQPETPFVRHTLAVTEHYARLVEAERGGRCELLTFDPEPGCWRQFTDPHGAPVVLKPDAYVWLGVGDYEERSFLEVDCATEGRGALARKCRLYLDYFRTGTEQAACGVFPRVVWVTTCERRVALLVEVCARLPAEGWALFAVTTPKRAVAVLAGQGGDERGAS